MKNCLLLAIGLFALSGCFSPQSDAQLTKLFNENEVLFQKLITLSDACLGNETQILWAREDEGAGNQCTVIMKKIKIRGMSKDSNGSISFYVEDQNYSSHQKGLVFSQTELSPTFDNLDKKPAVPAAPVRPILTGVQR